MMMMHLLELGLDLGNSLDRGERKSTCVLISHTQVAELPQKKQQLIPYLTTPKLSLAALHFQINSNLIAESQRPTTQKQTTAYI